MFRSTKRQEPTDGGRGPLSEARLAAVRSDGSAETAESTGQARAATATVEVERAMDASSDPASYPFAPADLDIDMMDKVRTGTNGTVAGPRVAPAVAAGDVAQLAQQATSIVQSLAERVRELESQQQNYAQQAAAYEEAARGSETLKQTLRETVLSSSISTEDLQTIQRVLAALAKDPNHIMVLASVAQQAGKLTTIVDSFSRLHRAVQQAPPR